ncbi:hypothetical protein [Pseudodesulfovibrio sp. zrk46]|uniref:hypothetical protein n=1 Tax=Pseudodesulfovibrio sp. zrk46 TaxID=2725288 RepID=UPI001448DC50|nr:hypothetical protein [Pseudodesulfovibrio sp. zrk46]QJB56165.1 hypothetical protein HFN16_06945 [Pseudodesulfovibrio sp. zrk46]
MFKTILFASLAATLSGCVFINAMLGVVGLVTSGPIQYAGTIYSVSEYAYEYAANDKTPDEVIVEKVAWLIGEDEEPVQLAKTDIAIPKPPELDWDAELRMKAEQASLRKPTPIMPPLAKAKLETPTMATPKPTSHPARVATKAAPRKPARVKRTAPATPVPVVVAEAIPTPSHTYIHHSPDPVQDRMNRMEHAFGRAEQMTGITTSQGIRYSLGNKKTGRTITAINGDWSIRHELMELPPQETPLKSSAEELPHSDLQVAS